MDFAAALSYLDEHTNLEANAGWVHGLSLDPIRGVVGVLGDPQLAAPVIHVTGTNGKGSVTRMITRLLMAHGLTVGSYTSPHLETINERIARNLEPISDDDFAEVLTEIAELEPLFPVRPNYFDIVTAAAFAWFAREAVDIMVIEVGLLGRYDATNVARADVAVVTSIGKDHTDGQGAWREAIAKEKAGIIETDSGVVLGIDDPELVPIFTAEGGNLHWVIDADFGVDSSVLAFGGRSVDLRTPSGVLDELFLPVHGDHQAHNAAVAVAAVEAFFGRPIDREVALEAFAELTLPGRFEIISKRPLVILDGAHNPQGTEVLAQTYMDEVNPNGALTIVVGALRGRDAVELLEPLAALDPTTVVVVEADSPRAIPVAEFALAAAEVFGIAVEQVADVATAFERVLDRLGEDDAMLVCGSHYVSGSARAAARRRGLVTD